MLKGNHRSIVVGRDVVLEPPVAIGVIVRGNRLLFIPGDVGDRVPENSVN